MTQFIFEMPDISSTEESTKIFAGLYRIASLERQLAEIKEVYFEKAYRYHRGWELKEMPYKDYLVTPEWQVTRKQALSNADHKCQLCNTEGTELHVHHKTYERRGEELPDDLIVLCKDCHAKFHDKEPA